MSERPRVFATTRLPGPAWERLERETRLTCWPGPGPLEPSGLAEAVQGMDGLLCTLSDAIDRALLDVGGALRVVSTFSVGVDHVDLQAAAARGIPIGHTPGVLTETTAELTLALLLAVARRLPEAERYLRDGRWTDEQAWDPELLLGRDLRGQTLGVVGLGPIGRAVATRARAFGMHVLGWSRTARELPGVEPVSFEALLERSDFVSVHVALATETRGLLGPAELARMKPGAFLVNTARGPLIDQAALAEALASGRLAGAGLDVFEREPLPPDSPLLELPNVVLLPHVGSATVATRERMATLAIENLLAGLRGEPLPAEVGRASAGPARGG